MTAKSILAELPEESKQALTRQAIREGKTISQLLADITHGAAQRVLSDARQDSPEGRDIPTCPQPKHEGAA